MLGNQPRLAFISNLVLGFLIAVGSFVAFVPIAPDLPTISLDDGWKFAMNVALAKGLVFGRDIIFTFGPYASASTAQYHPATDTQMLWSTSILALAFVAGLISLSNGKPLVAAVVLMAFLPLVARDSLFFALPFIFLLLICRLAMPEAHPARITSTGRVRLSLGLLVLALALIPLVKGTFAAASVAVIVLAWLLCIMRGHKALAMSGLVLFCVAMPVFWMIAHQPLAQLPVFFLTQGPIISGYTDAMSISGPVWQPIAFVICGFVICLLDGRFLYSADLAGKVLLVGTAILLFFGFKAGFVRQDSHSLISAGMLAMVAWILMLGRNGYGPLFGTIVGLSCWALIEYNTFGLNPTTVLESIKQPLIADAHMLATRLWEPGALKAAYTNNLAVDRAQRSLPRLYGTVDVYSYEQAMLLANGMDWDPRPVMQSYSAYTPSLEEANANHLKGPDAPANVLFFIEPIDRRLAALEDGTSWPALLTGYDFAELRGDMAIMHRRPESTILQPAAGAPTMSGIFALGQTIALPMDNRMTWARLEVAPTLLGKVMAALYKPPQLTITYRFTDGREQSFRYVAAMGSAGFLVAPLVESTKDFVALALPDAAEYFARRRPVSISITAVHGVGWLWRSSFSAQFFGLHIPDQPGVSSMLFDHIKTAAEHLANLPTTPGCYIDFIDQKGIGNLPVPVGRFLQVAGWGAISIKDATAPDSTEVTLTSPDGTVHAIPARKVARDDVNLYFHKPNMGPVGFAASADLSDFGGDYVLGVEMSTGDKKWRCSQVVPIHVDNLRAAVR